MKGMLFKICAISFLALLSICGGRGNSSASLSTSSDKGPDISLTASVERIRYCAGDNEVYTAHLLLALRYTNLSTRKAILYNSRQPIDIGSGAIAENPTALQEKRYESTFSYDEFRERPSVPDSERPSGSQFVILEPGGAYDLTGKVAIVVRFKAAPVLSGTIVPGNHTMRVDVVNWPFAFEDGERLRKRWADSGTLYYEAKRTAPFQVALEATPQLEDCSPGVAIQGEKGDSPIVRM